MGKQNLIKVECKFKKTVGPNLFKLYNLQILIWYFKDKKSMLRTRFVICYALSKASERLHK